MVQYRAGYKYVPGGVHAQVRDFPAAISFGHDLDDARRMLGLALVDVAETLFEFGEPLPRPDATIGDPEMDVHEPILLHVSASALPLSATVP